MSCIGQKDANPDSGGSNHAEDGGFFLLAICGGTLSPNTEWTHNWRRGTKRHRVQYLIHSYSESFSPEGNKTFHAIEKIERFFPFVALFDIYYYLRVAKRRTEDKRNVWAALS